MGLDGRCRVASIVGRQRVPTSRDATAGMHPPRFLSCKANVIAQESTCWAEAAKVWSRKCLRPDRDSTAICLYPDLHCSGPRFDHRGKPLSASSMLTQINPPLLETDWNHSSSSQDRLLPCSRLTQTTLVLFKTDSSHSSCSQDCFKSLLLFLRLTLVTPLLKADSFFLGVCYYLSPQHRSLSRHLTPSSPFAGGGARRCLCRRPRIAWHAARRLVTTQISAPAVTPTTMLLERGLLRCQGLSLHCMCMGYCHGSYSVCCNKRNFADNGDDGGLHRMAAHAFWQE